MTSSTEVMAEVSAEPDRAKLLKALKADATYLPQAFAIYGFVCSPDKARPDAPFLGWGIDLGDDYGAFFWEPNARSTHHARCAERILKFHQRFGEAYLEWLG